MERKIKVSLFCGGRGCTTLIHELLRITGVELNLLVNAYDNGASTGEMRRFIPGYLGPSDFRKNLSYLLEFHSPEQFSLAKLINYRMPADFNTKNVNDLIGYLNGAPGTENLPFDLINLLEAVNGELKDNICDYLDEFFDYYIEQNKPFNFKGCSFGNVLFAGAFFKNNKDFQKATKELMAVFKSKINANLINVTDGQNRFLMALKEDNVFLDDESKIVEKQSSARYAGIYLLPEQFTKEEIEKINRFGFDEKKRFLETRSKNVGLSCEAKAALKDCDVIIFGPGTQFSSLLPSYMTEGMRDAIASSRAKIKAFVVNINKDHDIGCYKAEDLIDTALKLLGDENNSGNLITHALYDIESNSHDEGIKCKGLISSKNFRYKNIEFIIGNYRHPIYPGIHNGRKTIKAVLDLCENEHNPSCARELDIYIDLCERSLAIKLLLEEFLEIDWKKNFSLVRLHVNNADVPDVKLPEYIKILSCRSGSYFPENEFFLDWFFNKNSKYLVTLTGDGEYRFRDIILSTGILEGSSFGAIYGSRNQSRRQFINSINSAYGESRFISFISSGGAMLLGILFALRLGVFFSDPSTGFRIYNRTVLKNQLKKLTSKKHLNTSTALTRNLIDNKIDIAEIPVHYRTFKGFTNVRWRVLRGLRNLTGIFV